MTSQLFVEVGRLTVWETNEGAGWEFLLGTLARNGPGEVARCWGSQGLILNNFKILLSFFFW